MKEFKVGDKVKITKPEITTVQVSACHSVDWVEEMDYLDSTIQEITGIGYGGLPDIEYLDSKGGKLKRALHPDWCELVTEEKKFKVGDEIRIKKPNLKNAFKPRMSWGEDMDYLDGCLRRISRIDTDGDMYVLERGKARYIHPDWCELVSEEQKPIGSVVTEPGEVIIPAQNPITPVKMKIYIAGKITGIPFSEAKNNFDSAKELIEKWGFEAVSPLDYGDENKSWVDNMLILLPILNTCDGIYLLDNWDESDGARIEKKFAEKKGMFVINEIV